MSKRIVYRVIWVSSLVMLCGAVFAFGRVPTSAPTPGPLIDFTTGDKALSIKHPDNWKPGTLELHDVATSIKFEPAKNFYFKVKADLAGSLMADIAKSTGAQLDSLGSSLGVPSGGEHRKSPLEQMHEMQGEEYANGGDFDSYTEGATKKTTIAGNEAMLTEFTYKESGTWGKVGMVGLRGTAISNDRRITVLCYCPASAKNEFWPIFGQMIASVQLGHGG